MKIETYMGDLDLGGQFSIDIEETNPVLNDRGSQSIPVTVPASPQNAKCFGHAHRVDMASRPLASDDSCTISDGVYLRRGKIHLVSAGRREGYEFNVGLDTSTAYQAWRAMKLNALDLPTYAAGSVSNLCTRMQSVMDGTITDADYAVFQITTNVVEKTETASVGVEITTRIHEYLNETTVADPDTDAGDWTNVSQSLVWQARTKTILVNNTEVQVSLPAGYGVTPFLYVWKIIELVFTAYGFTLASNPFHTDDTLRRLVILNNAADCCCTGTLHYADLMPDCTIDDFLSSLYAKFGMVFDTNSNTGVARIFFIRDIVGMEPVEDYTLRRIEEPFVTYEDARQVRLSSNKSLDGAAPPDERYETFIRNSGAAVRSVARVTSTMAQPAWIMFERCTGKMWRYDADNHVQACVGSANFNWDRSTDGVGDNDVASSDEMLAMDFAGNGILNPMYLTGYVHRYTEIKSSDVDVSDEEDNVETPLSFCLAFQAPANCYTFGSSLIYTPWGERVRLQDGTSPEHTLLWQFDTGLFAHYWRDYDGVLRHAMNQVEVDVAMAPEDVMQADILQPVLFQGQPMLIDKMAYRLPAPRRMPVSMTFRTLRLIGPYNLATEQRIPSLTQAEGHTYRWTLSSALPDWNEATRAEAIRAEWQALSGYNTTLNSYERVYVGQDPADYIASILPPVTADDIKRVTLKAKTVANLTADEPTGPDTFDFAGSFPTGGVSVVLTAVVDS